VAFQAQNQITDNLDDDVGKCLQRLHANPTWTAEKVSEFEELLRLCKLQRYFRFTGDFRDYHLERKGQSCLYDVPANQRGALEKFRGKRVRLICEGAWNQYAGRHFLAKSVGTQTK
jgi:hypothetical protein